MKNYPKSSEEYIRLEAYLLSESAGHPHGMDAFFWAQAEAIVRARFAQEAIPKSPAAKKASLARKVATKTTSHGAAPAKKAVSKPALMAPATTTEKRAVTPKATQKKPSAASADKPISKRKASDGKKPFSA